MRSPAPSTRRSSRVSRIPRSSGLPCSTGTGALALYLQRQQRHDADLPRYGLPRRSNIRVSQVAGSGRTSRGEERALAVESYMTTVSRLGASGCPRQDPAGARARPILRATISAPHGRSSLPPRDQGLRVAALGDRHRPAGAAQPMAQEQASSKEKAAPERRRSRQAPGRLLSAGPDAAWERLQSS